MARWSWSNSTIKYSCPLLEGGQQRTRPLIHTLVVHPFWWGIIAENIVFFDRKVQATIRAALPRPIKIRIVDSIFGNLDFAKTTWTEHKIHSQPIAEAASGCGTA